MSDRVDTSPDAPDTPEEQVVSSSNDAQAPAPTRGVSRRHLCLGVGGIVALAALGGLKLMGHANTLRPPGGQDQDRLLATCIRCERCVEACPRAVIVPSHVEDGILETRLPTLSFEDDFCDWCAESNGGVPKCVQACPTHALALPPGATAENVIIGKADLATDLCLAHRQASCRSCYDACPYDAMELDEVGRPRVIAERCNGCGACEAVCVSLKNASIIGGASRRAIIVEPVN